MIEANGKNVSGERRRKKKIHKLSETDVFRIGLNTDTGMFIDSKLI